MTLAGRPSSRMARGYAELLATGEKGVYVALWTDRLDPVKASAGRMGLPTRATTLGAWQFLSFPGAGDAAAIFWGRAGCRRTTLIRFWRTRTARWAWAPHGSRRGRWSTSC
jgi:hypothetical protein